MNEQFNSQSIINLQQQILISNNSLKSLLVTHSRAMNSSQQLQQTTNLHNPFEISALSNRFSDSMLQSTVAKPYSNDTFERASLQTQLNPFINYSSSFQQQPFQGSTTSSSLKAKQLNQHSRMNHAHFSLLPPSQVSYGYQNEDAVKGNHTDRNNLDNNGKQVTIFQNIIESKENSSLAGNTSITTTASGQTFFMRKSLPESSTASNAFTQNQPLLSSRNSIFSQNSSTGGFPFNSSLTSSLVVRQDSEQPKTAQLMKVSSLGASNIEPKVVPSINSQARSSSSNAYKGDRFIPFRGNSDNYFLEEFMLNSGDVFRELRKISTLPSSSNDATIHGSNLAQNEPNSIRVDVSMTPNAPSTQTLNDHDQQSQLQPPGSLSGESGNIGMTADRIRGSVGSSGASSTQYSLGSGHKKKQSFQELITESLFTQKRGSPNTLTLQEAEEEELRFSRLPGGKKRTSEFQENQEQRRILQFKEKKSRPSMSLHKNISLIKTLAQEKTHRQQKNLRCIPQYPEKILDAPDLVDDYYLNLLDWSSQNVLAVCLSQTVYLWNSETGEIKELYDTGDDNDIVTSVAWMKGSSPVLAIGTSSKQLHLWDTATFSRIKTFENLHDGRISSLSWNPTYSHLLSSGSLDSQIQTIDIRTPQQSSIISTFQYHRQEVCGLKWSPDGQQLASGGNDNVLCIWDINSRMRQGIYSQNLGQQTSTIVTQPRFAFQDHRAAVKALAWCPWQRHLLASGGGSRDQTIKFWNTDSGTLVQSVQTESQVCSLQWNPYDREILSSHGFVNNQLCIWKYPQMKKIADLRGHTSRVLHLALSPDGTTVASAAADETLRFWKVFQSTSTSLGAGHQTHKNNTTYRLLSNVNDGDASSKSCLVPSDIIMTDCNKFFQASPSQFNGFSLR